MGEIMRKSLIVLIVVFSVFLAIGCTENKSGISNETGIPAKATNETVKETPIAEITPAAFTPTGETATGKQNATEMQNTTGKQNATEMQNATNIPTIKEFTLEELAQYNGKNGTSYVAYQGKVYDISSSSLWENGTHKGHSAGKDITEELNDAPHGPDKLKGFPVVGTLKK
jgi:predicted heme/steroid binding protein